MVTVRDVPAQEFIGRLAEELKKEEPMQPHKLSTMVKSGSCAERPPQQPDFWYLRSAAILRKVYLSGPIGTQRLRTVYGDRKRRGHKPAHHRPAGGKFIRLMLQQLEKTGYIQKTDKPVKGRAITPKGQKFLDSLAKSMS